MLNRRDRLPGPSRYRNDRDNKQGARREPGRIRGCQRRTQNTTWSLNMLLAQRNK